MKAKRFTAFWAMIGIIIVTIPILSFGQSYYPYMYQQPYNPYDPYRSPFLDDGYRPPPDFSNWNWIDPWTAYDPGGRGAAAVTWQPEYLGSSPYFRQTGYPPYNYNTPYTFRWNQQYSYGWNQPYSYGPSGYSWNQPYNRVWDPYTYSLSQPYTFGGWSPYSLLSSYYPGKYSPVGYLSPTYYTTDYIDADVKVDGDDDEDSITLEVGETLSVTLQTTESAYMSYTYTWELDTGELDTAIVKKVADYLPSKSAGPLHHEFVFKARGAGTTIIKIDNTSYDNDTWIPPFGNTFEIEVTVVEG